MSKWDQYEVNNNGNKWDKYLVPSDTANQAGQQAYQSEQEALQKTQTSQNPVSQWADQTVQQNTEAKKDWNIFSGVQDPIGWATKEIPATVANAVKGVEKVGSGLGQFGQGVAGLASNIADMTGGMFTGSTPQEQDNRFNEGLQSFGQGMQGINNAWSGALEIIGSPLPLLPDFIEKPATHVYGGVMGAVDSGENALLNAFGVPEGSQLNSFIRQASQNAINTAAMGAGARAKMNPKEISTSMQGGNAPILEQRALEARKAFDETGINPTPSMVSSVPVLTQIEALAAKGFFGSKLTNKIQEVGNKMKTYVENTINEKAPSLNDAEIGHKIYSTFENNKRQHQDLMDGMFTEFTNNYGSVPASITHLESNIRSVLDQTAKNFGRENPMAKELADMSSKFAKGATFDNIQATRTAWRERLDSLKGTTPDPVLGPNASLAQKVYDAMTHDMIDTVNAVDGQAGKQLKTMNQYYASKLEEFNSHYGSTIERAANLKDAKSYENIIDGLVKPGNHSQLPALKNMLGKDGMEFVQAGFLTKVMKSATDTNTGIFSPSKFAKELNKYGDKTIRGLFDDKGYYLLNNLKTIGERTQPLQKVMEGSQTGFLNRVVDAPTGKFSVYGSMGSAGLSGAGSAATVAVALLPIALDYGANKFLASEIGKQVATGEFFKKSVGVVQNIKAATKKTPTPIKDTVSKGIELMSKIRSTSAAQKVEQENRNKKISF